MGIQVFAHIAAIAGISDTPFDPLAPDMDSIQPDFPVIKPDAGAQMRDAISAAKGDGDSVGGIVECAVTGLPAGVGEPMFGGVESRIAQIVYGVPAVKGVEFGAGFSAANLRGSQNNDDYVISDGQIPPPAERRSERWKSSGADRQRPPRPMHRPQSRSGDRGRGRHRHFRHDSGQHPDRQEETVNGFK